MDPPQPPAQAHRPVFGYHDHRQRLMRDALGSRLDAFCQYVRSQSDSVAIPADFATLDAFLSRIESETYGPRQESSWVYNEIGWGDFDTVEELIMRLHHNPEMPPFIHLSEDMPPFIHLSEDMPPFIHLSEDMPPFIHPSNADPGQFLVGSVLFAFFMRITENDRRGGPVATLMGFFPDPAADFAADFAADVERWRRFILLTVLPELMLRQELEGRERLRPLLSDADELLLLQGLAIAGGSRSPSPSPSSPDADALVAALPAVDAPEEQSCPICMDPYADAGELAVRLPCRHVLGGNCLAAWFRAGTVTCPFCRAPVNAGNVDS
ncbi:hypothetical protein MMC07_001108 [Pseudocyphellaria aurata]|nr:hypothetical protein [Pseudocyphellaria aurata]